MKTTLLSLMAAFGLAAATPAEPVITAIVDGDLPGGNPKFIELWIEGTVDLSRYSLERASNGEAFKSVIPSLEGTYTNQFVYLLGSSRGGEAVFTDVFGSAGFAAKVNRIVNKHINGNGNDGFRILRGKNVVDQVWTSNRNDAYRDSYMYRKDGTGPDGEWVPENWIIPRNDALSYKDAEEHKQTIPLTTYSGPVPPPATILLLGLALVAFSIRGKISSR